MLKYITMIILLMSVACKKKTRVDTVYVDRPEEKTEEDQEKKEKKKKKTTSSLIQTTTIHPVRDIKLVEMLFVENVRAHDKVIITISGKRYIPQFEDNIVKESIVSWKEKKCLDPNTCLKINRQGTCTLKFRKQVPEIEEIIDLTQKSNHHLNVMIGSFNVDIGTPTLDENNNYQFEFIVLDNMIENGTDLFLAVFPPENVPEVKVGFLEFIDCPHAKKDEFQSIIKRDFENFSLYNVEEYQTSVRVEY